ncbi:MAG TPA: hypothetical protein VKZ63_13855 [Kofleriaceae bacterium]|nr:hypothetical protein [Kofleriaceae bacterium]
MPLLSSTAWILHDLGLATSIGGTLFGRAAMHPALDTVSDPQERDRVAEVAWRRFQAMNLAGHGAMALSWMVGRRMLSGEEVSRRGHRMTRTKDALVLASVATGVGTALLGRALARCIQRERGPQRVREANGRISEREAQRARRLEQAVRVVGTLNVAANAGVAAVTTLLAMESGESLRFVRISRHLP